MIAVSVIMSTRSRNYGDEYTPNLLKRSVDSVLNQTFRDLEFIIIDDNSSDGTAAILAEYQQRDNRVKVIRFAESCEGLTSKRYNFGVQQSSGKWIALMADDDCWLPNLLSTLYTHAIAQSILPALVYGKARIIRTQTPNAPILIMGHEWNGNIMRYNHVPNLSVLINRQTYITLGGSDENPKMKRYSDWEYWRRIWAAKLPVVFIPVILADIYEGKPDGLRRTIEATEFSDYSKSEQIIPDMSILKGVL